MKGKLLYILIIGYITIIAIVFRSLYPEVRITAVMTIVAILGFVLAIITNFIIDRVKKEKARGKDDKVEQ